ncbi:MAG: FAD-binding oxidoreductase [Anaerolineae bacterium]|nr:FAD-binding oxidoreductase [Gemmatimonadaceae bacterium]
MILRSEQLAACTVTEVREEVRDARRRDEAIRIAGSATWMDAGRVVRAERLLSVSGLNGVIHYIPGDFTITVRAGTTLQHVAAMAAEERQWLALEPFGARSGTVGATIATGSYGPLAHAFGTPRDHVLGLRVVTGNGDLLTVGGRVVKNVAGFDLTRLFTGSWGTLGIITEATFRLRALPEVDESYALAVDNDPQVMDAQLRAISSASIAPYSVEMLNAALAQRLGVGTDTTILVRLGGNSESVRAQVKALSQLNTVGITSPEIWSSFRECEPEGATVIRFARRPSHLGGLWRSAVKRAAGALVHASVGRGVVRCIVNRDNDEQLTGERWWDPGSAIVERGADIPLHSSGPLAAVTCVRAGISRRIKDVFDPSNILNPGIMGDVG